MASKKAIAIVGTEEEKGEWVTNRKVNEIWIELNENAAAVSKGCSAKEKNDDSPINPLI